MTLDLKHERAGEVLRRLDRRHRRRRRVGPAGARCARRASATQSSAATQPGLVWCSITGFGAGQPVRRPARARHHLPRLLGADGAHGRRHRAADARLRARGAVRRAHRGRSASSSAVAARDRTGVGRVRRHQHRRRRHVGASARRWRASPPGSQAGWGQSANRRAYRAADGKLDHRSPPPSRGRGARSARRSNAPTSSRGCRRRPTARPRSPRSWRRSSPPAPPPEWVEQLAGRRRGRSGNSVDDLFDDPHVQARGSIVELDGDGAGTRSCAHPCGSGSRDGTEEPFAAGPPPALGEHTDDALAAAGFTARRDRRAARRRRGLIRHHRGAAP